MGIIRIGMVNPKWIKIASVITGGLTMLSVAPYELGSVADVFPPDVKKWVMMIGTAATVILRILGHVMTPSGQFVQPAIPQPTPVLQQTGNALK